MSYDPSFHAGCDACPVEQLSGYEAEAYCNALSTAAGRDVCYACSGSGTSVVCGLSPAYATPYDCPGYRLPTEAEWELAARAGTATATYNGDLDASHLDCEEPNAALDPIAWFCGNSAGASQPVGAAIRNRWGLYDMLGNVLEWCHEHGGSYDASVVDPCGGSTILRGGSYNNGARMARAAMRLGYAPESRDLSFGFRPARTLP
jgi:formylglycine-generating enzyme required for sulfatase activity